MIGRSAHGRKTHPGRPARHPIRRNARPLASSAVRARWRMLTAQLRRSAVAESVAERATPALARSAVVADTSQLEIKGRRYEHGLYFLLSGQLSRESLRVRFYRSERGI